MNPRKIPGAMILILVPLILLGGQNNMVTDDLGCSHLLDTPPERIISMAPNITEILFALGLEKEIIGVTRYCNFPPQAQQKGIIGGLIDPNLEKILSLRPDLIIAFRGNPLRLINRLKGFELHVFVLESGTTLESVFSIIHKTGLITHREEEAEKLIHQLREKLEKIQSSLENVICRPKVFINLHGQGLWTSGKNSFLNDLVAAAKGVNIARESSRSWLSYNREELIRQNPDYIIVITRSEKEFFSAKKWLMEKAHLDTVQAVQTGHVHFLQEDLATRPGPRIFKALDQLAKILHPDCWKQGG